MADGNPATGTAAGDKRYATEPFIQLAQMAPHAYLQGVIGMEMVEAMLT